MLIWTENGDKVIWGNKTFHDTKHRTAIPDLALKSFDIANEVKLNCNPVSAILKHSQKNKLWHYEIIATQFEKFIYYIAFNTVAHVNIDRNHLGQNIAETFSHCPVGIAFFNLEHRLTIFNPKLIELLDLSQIWLTNMPDIKQFFETLRDRGILPEPPDFKAWYQQFVDDTIKTDLCFYRDDWNMPNGCIYHVSAYMHSNKSISIYIENITANITADRQYRLHLKSLYNVFDALDTAIVLFESNGKISFTNQAYDILWDHKFSNSLIVMDITSMLQIWLQKCYPSPAFSQLHNFIFQIKQRQQWSTDIMLLSGETLVMKINPLNDSQTLCEFVTAPACMPNAN